MSDLQDFFPRASAAAPRFHASYVAPSGAAYPNIFSLGDNILEVNTEDVNEIPGASIQGVDVIRLPAGAYRFYVHCGGFRAHMQLQLKDGATVLYTGPSSAYDSYQPLVGELILAATTDININAYADGITSSAFIIVNSGAPERYIDAIFEKVG